MWKGKSDTVLRADIKKVYSQAQRKNLLFNSVEKWHIWQLVIKSESRLSSKQRPRFNSTHQVFSPTGAPTSWFHPAYFGPEKDKKGIHLTRKGESPQLQFCIHFKLPYKERKIQHRVAVIAAHAMLLYASWIDFIAPHCFVKLLNSKNSKDRVLYMFAMWWFVTCRQRINTNDFNAMWFILLKERKNNDQNQDVCNHVHKNSTQSNGCSLFSRRSSSIMPDLIVPPRPSPCCSRLCWALTAYLFPFQVAWARPHPPPLILTQFPSDPRQQPLSMSGTVFYGYFLGTGWGDESWTAFCGSAAAAVGGLWPERLVKSDRRPSKRHFTYRDGGVISLATNSSLKALHRTDLSQRSVRAPAPVGASFLRWKSSWMTDWTWCDYQEVERSDASRMSSNSGFCRRTCQRQHLPRAFETTCDPLSPEGRSLMENTLSVDSAPACTAKTA